ncbi:MAG: DUF2249 domain-containing protein [Bacteroidia bacterium]|nr:DUF2249 domain-containing protein [Bacteroidia bacterium]MCO5254418.1 DUF2249 domain-containing protein [Bacteroidota bacterium]
MSNTSEPIKEYDVRELIPIDRHTMLLDVFKNLPTGYSFTFINDHDPLPLFYEFRSIHGDVVGWDYLNRGGREWKVKVTRLEDSIGREFTEISTMMDLRKVEKKDWKHVIFHRYGMMKEGDVMEIVAAENPEEIYGTFIMKFEGQFRWVFKKKEPGEFIIHLTKTVKSGLGDDGFMVVNEFDVRPYTPTERHEIFYKAFADIKAGEAFILINDHDPKPLYYQMEAESKEPFRWEYLEEGPEVWKVRVIKVKE